MIEPGTPRPGAAPGGREELLAEAIRLLAETSRLTRPVLEPAAAAGSGAPQAGVEFGRWEPADWATGLSGRGALTWRRRGPDPGQGPAVVAWVGQSSLGRNAARAGSDGAT